LTVLPTDSHMGLWSYAFRGISDLLMSIDLSARVHHKRLYVR
jgi:hypothetical protein